MEFAQFPSAVRRFIETGEAQVRFGEGVALSLPVVVRRGERQYDAMFLYRQPGEDKTAPRPHAWMLLDAESGELVHYSLCEHGDFMPPGVYPPGSELPMTLPKPLTAKKLAAMQDKLLDAYGEIRTFAFSENLTRPQAAVVATYKDMFQRMSYPAHYPFYHSLSPSFLHWLRLPLPKEALSGATAEGAAQPGGVQLLILENLQLLVGQFQNQIATDTRKDQLFDELHRELQEYKNGMLGTLTLAMERDVIQIIDDVAKSVAAFRDKEGSPEDYRKLLALFEGVETDLTDLLYRHGVEPYTVEGGVDVGRQKILQSLPTDDAALDKTVAVRHARGWEKEDKVIRPERISVYVYKGESAT